MLKKRNCIFVFRRTMYCVHNKRPHTLRIIRVIINHTLLVKQVAGIFYDLLLKQVSTPIGIPT